MLSCGTRVSIDCQNGGVRAMVRKRQVMVTGFDAELERLHCVCVQHNDEQHPGENQLIWELEPQAALLELMVFSRVSFRGPLPVGNSGAVLFATRWSVATSVRECQWPGLSSSFVAGTRPDHRGGGDSAGGQAKLFGGDG